MNLTIEKTRTGPEDIVCKITQINNIRRACDPVLKLLCPLCNTHTDDTHHLFNCTHIRTTLSPLDLWTNLPGVMELLAGGPKAG